MLFDRDKFLRFLGSKGQHSRSNWNKICLKSTLGVDVGSTRGLLSSSEFPVCLNYHKSHKMVKLCVCLCVCHSPPPLALSVPNGHGPLPHSPNVGLHAQVMGLFTHPTPLISISKKCNMDR